MMRRIMRQRCWIIGACGAMVVALAGGGCTYEKVVNYKPFFTGLEGARHGTDPVVERSRTPSAISERDQRTVIEHPDGTVTLVSRSGRNLLSHIIRTLANDEPDLFLEFLLSERTKMEYAERGLDPIEAFRTLKRHEREVRTFASRMPLGEQSPHVIMEKLDQRAFRVKLTGQAKRDMQWTFMDMVLEFGQWKLRWFGPVAEPKETTRRGAQ